MPVATRKDWAKALQAQHDIRVVLSCMITGMSRTAFYYQPKRCDDSEVITVLNTLVERHQRWGFPKCFKRIRALGYRWNHKRVQRVYNALRLNRCLSSKLSDFLCS